MNAQSLPGDLRRMTRELERYAMNEFPGMAGRKILRFINGNFRAQGWQGKGFEPWKPNASKTTILIKRGIGRRSIKQQVAPGEVRTWTDSKYMAMHNRGFTGTVKIRAHNRRKFSRQKVGTGRFTKSGKERKKTIHVQTGEIPVKAHTRKMHIVKRQFMPESASDSPVLFNSIRRDVEKKLKTIFN